MTIDNKVNVHLAKTMRGDINSWFLIFGFLSPEEYAKMSRVCKEMVQYKQKNPYIYTMHDSQQTKHITTTCIIIRQYDEGNLCLRTFNEMSNLKCLKLNCWIDNNFEYISKLSALRYLDLHRCHHVYPKDLKWIGCLKELWFLKIRIAWASASCGVRMILNIWII